MVLVCAVFRAVVCDEEATPKPPCVWMMEGGYVLREQLLYDE